MTSPSEGGQSNTARHRIAARLPFGMKPKGHGWAARGALER